MSWCGVWQALETFPPAYSTLCWDGRFDIVVDGLGEKERDGDGVTTSNQIF